MTSDEDKGGRDLYAVLELASDATLDDIRRAFRAIAAKNHPDRHPGDAKAALRFKQINAAYQVLSDPERKYQYDQLTAPIEEMALAPRAAPVRHEEREEPVIRRRRVRRKRSKGRVAWALFGTASAFIAAALFIPDIRHLGFADKPAPSVAPLEDPAATIETTEARMPPPEVAALPERPLPGRGTMPTAPAPEDDLPVRTVNGDHWTFVIPADWQDAADAKGPRWTAPGAIDGYKPSVRLETASFNGEAAKYFEDLDRKVPSGVIIDAESWESATTPDGLRREARVGARGTLVSRFVQYAVAVRGRGYVLTCSGPPNAFDSVRPLCDRILGSLQIK